MHIAGKHLFYQPKVVPPNAANSNAVQALF